MNRGRLSTCASLCISHRGRSSTDFPKCLMLLETKRRQKRSKLCDHNVLGARERREENRLAPKGAQVSFIQPRWLWAERDSEMDKGMVC